MKEMKYIKEILGKDNLGYYTGLKIGDYVRIYTAEELKKRISQKEYNVLSNTTRTDIVGFTIMAPEHVTIDNKCIQVFQEEVEEIEHTCATCANHIEGYDITMTNDECGGCCSWNDKWILKDNK